MASPLPPGPPGRRLTGHVSALRRDRLAFFTWCARTYGDVVPIRFGPKRAVLVSEPALIEQVLVTRHRHFVRPYVLRKSRRTFGDALFVASGQPHRRRRRLAQPAFHRRRIAGYADDMVAAAAGALAQWEDGQVRDLHADMTALTLEVAGRALFGVDVHGDATSVGEAMTVMSRAFAARMDTPLPLPDRTPTPANLRNWMAVRRLERIVYRLIADTRRQAGEADHLLAMLVDAHDDEGGKLTDEELRDDALGFLLAGHETTALALTWTLLLLARHPGVAARLRAEVDEVLRGRPPTLDDVPRLAYTDRVLREGLRLYPPIYAFGREAVTACDLGPYRLPAGWSVIVAPWVVHRDPRFHPRPDEFDPGRWDGDATARLPRYAYFPFGGGPHQCIGASFAQLEAVLVLASVAQRFELEAVPDREPVLAPQVTLRPGGPVPVTVHARAASRGRGPVTTPGRPAGTKTSLPDAR